MRPGAGFWVPEEPDKPEVVNGEAEFYHCGGCESYHPTTFDGDCREDINRFAGGELDEKYGPHGWREVPMPGSDAVLILAAYEGEACPDCGEGIRLDISDEEPCGNCGYIFHLPPDLDVADAFQIVLDLAKQNVIDDPEMSAERARQEASINIITDVAVNQFGDDARSDTVLLKALQTINIMPTPTLANISEFINSTDPLVKIIVSAWEADTPDDSFNEIDDIINQLRRAQTALANKGE